MFLVKINPNTVKIIINLVIEFNFSSKFKFFDGHNEVISLFLNNKEYKTGWIRSKIISRFRR